MTRAGRQRGWVWPMALAAAALAAAYLAYMWQQVGTPYPMDYGEGVLWWASWFSGDLRAVYKSPLSFPYIATNYPPVYLWVAKGLSGVTGSWLVAGRTVSAASGFAVALVLGWMVWSRAAARVGKAARLAAAAAAFSLPLATFTVDYWGRFARVDLLALALLYGGLAVFMGDRAGSKRGYVAMALFVLAAFTKQTTLVGPALCVGLTALADWRRAAKLAAFGAVLGGGAFARFYVATGGGFLLNTVGYNLNPFVWSRLGEHWPKHVDAAAPMLMAGLAAVVVLGQRVTARGWRRSLRRGGFDRGAAILVAHWVLALLQTLGVAKMGASINYFLELDLTSCAVIGMLAWLLLYMLTKAERVRTEALAGLAFVLLLQLSSLVFLGSAAAPNAKEAARVERERRDFAGLVEVAKRTPGALFAEDVSVLMAAGRGDARALGEQAPMELERMLAERRFGALFIENVRDPERYAARTTALIEAGYRPGERHGLTVVWERK